WNTYPRWDSYFNYTPEWDRRFKPLKTFIDRHGAKPRNVSDFGLIADHGELISDDLVRDSALTGTVEDVARQIVEVASTGITHIALYPMPLAGQTLESVLEQFTKHVIPAVAKLQGGWETQ